MIGPKVNFMAKAENYREFQKPRSGNTFIRTKQSREQQAYELRSWMLSPKKGAGGEQGMVHSLEVCSYKES